MKARDARKAREAEGWTTRGDRSVWKHRSGAKIHLDPSGMWVALDADGARVGVFANQRTAFERAAKC